MCLLASPGGCAPPLLSRGTVWHGGSTNQLRPTLSHRVLWASISTGSMQPRLTQSRVKPSLACYPALKCATLHPCHHERLETCHLASSQGLADPCSRRFPDIHHHVHYYLPLHHGLATASVCAQSRHTHITTQHSSFNQIVICTKYVRQRGENKAIDKAL